MTDREELAGLADDVLSYIPWGEVTPSTGKEIADHLIANGVTIQQWIPVTERLPVDWCPVLVIVREVEKPLIGSYREGMWFHERWNTTFFNGAVTHWMPLPEPPKEA